MLMSELQSDNMVKLSDNMATVGRVLNCAEHRVDNIKTSLLFAEQDFHRTKIFSASCSVTLARGLGVLERLGRDTARTSDIN